METLGRTVELRVCAGCGLGFLEPSPSESELEKLYSADYAYYGAPRAAGLRDRWKYRLAGWRHLALVRGAGTASVPTAAAAVIEAVAGRTVSYSLGLPIALGRAARILDFGCGSGEWLTRLAGLGFRRLCGADIAANRIFRPELAASGVEALSIDDLARLPDGSFDVVRMEHVLEHLPRPAETLAELRRLLASGGWLALTVPSILPWKDRTDLDGSPDRAHLQIPMHLAHHSERSLTQLLREAGFVVVAIKVTRVEKYLTAAARPLAEGEM